MGFEIKYHASQFDTNKVRYSQNPVSQQSVKKSSICTEIFQKFQNGVGYFGKFSLKKFFLVVGRGV